MDEVLDISGALKDLGKHRKESKGKLNINDILQCGRAIAHVIRNSLLFDDNLPELRIAADNFYTVTTLEALQNLILELMEWQEYHGGVTIITGLKKFARPKKAGPRE